MGQLQPGVYGREMMSKVGPFGLHCAQMRGKNRIAKNHGWYNNHGEKVGWGDLEASDVANIQAGLEPNELFITIGEEGSFDEFVAQEGDIGLMCKTNPMIHSPGLEYVVQRCIYIITRETFYRAHRYAAEPYELHGVRIVQIDREQAARIITEANEDGNPKTAEGE